MWSLLRRRQQELKTQNSRLTIAILPLRFLYVDNVLTERCKLVTSACSIDPGSLEPTNASSAMPDASVNQFRVFFVTVVPSKSASSSMLLWPLGTVLPHPPRAEVLLWSRSSTSVLYCPIPSSVSSRETLVGVCSGLGGTELSLERMLSQIDGVEVKIVAAEMLRVREYLFA